MKIDQFGCVIREKYKPEFSAGNTGDSAHETGKYIVLAHDYDLNVMPFLHPINGYLRHPTIEQYAPWGVPSKFSGDQFVPMVLAHLSQDKPLSDIRLKGDEWQIPATLTVLTPASWCLIRGHYRLLNVFNWLQGVILKFPYRYNDQKKWFEKTKESSVDYLNMIVIWYFLKRKGKWATLATSKEKLKWAVMEYYKNGADPEPNVDWLVDIWMRALDHYG